MKFCNSILILLAAALLCAAPVAAITTVQAVPSSVTLAAGETATVDLVIDTLPNGISGGGKLTVSLTDGAVGDITGATFPDWAGLHSAGDLPADETVVKVADMGKQIGAGAKNVVFATLTITGVANGTTSLEVNIEKLDDDDGYPVNQEPTRCPLRFCPPQEGGDNEEVDRPAVVSTRSPTVAPTAPLETPPVRAQTDRSTPQQTATPIPVPTVAEDLAGEVVTACETCTVPVIPTPTQSPLGMLVPVFAMVGVAAICMGKR
ncbi:hypothetical protein [Methanogenium cariaci]|uniref:hypothetical protein n=1 Tax=Methanogenium cariaci TaxID=2197 RepID=UPI000782CC4A|nr:hypothetical protein [Methanogenium cariaci]